MILRLTPKNSSNFPECGDALKSLVREIYSDIARFRFWKFMLIGTVPEQLVPLYEYGCSAFFSRAVANVSSRQRCQLYQKKADLFKKALQIFGSPFSMRR